MAQAWRRIASALLCLAVVFSLKASGCTGFAAYSGQVVYGANFDWPGEPELEFALEHGTGSAKRFVLRFKPETGWFTMCGLNKWGLFASLQEVPSVSQHGLGQGRTMMLSQLFDQALESAASVSEVKGLLGDRRLIPPPGISLHSLFADVRGHTLIAEPGARANQLIPGSGNFAVMTNFYNSDLSGQDFRKVRGFGADRYRVAMEELRKLKGAVGLETGLGILKKTTQTITQASLLFLPEQQQVYLALKADFTRVYRFDLKGETVSTWRGFTKQRRQPLTTVSGTELSSWK